MKKICHLSSVHSRFDTRIFYKECSSLAKAGYDVSLIVADGGKYEIKNGVKIYGLKKQKSKLRRMLITPSALFKTAISLNADIYHLHDPELLPLGMKLKNSGKNVIFDSHEDVERQLLSKPYLHPLIARILSLFYAIYEKRVVSSLDLIITATPFIRDKFKKYHNNVIDINNYPIIDELKSEKRKSKGNSVTFIGGITEIRGIKQMVKALELCTTNVRLKIAGNFLSQSLRDEVMQYEGWRNVDELGYIDRKEIQNLLSTVQAGLVLYLPLPNHINAQPNKMFEYMSAGVPVLASQYPLWKTIIEGKQCGVCVDPTDPKAIAQAIDWIINHPKEAHLMGMNGLNAIKKFYNWKNEEKKLIEAYKSLY